MSYSIFLVIFICLPILGFLRVLVGQIPLKRLVTILGLATIAFLYTTPWDNYLVAKRVWYYDPKLVLNILIGYVPLEEYAFFILQTILTGLFVFWLWRRFYARDFDKK